MSYRDTGTSTSHKPVIFWDSASNKYVIRLPNNTNAKFNEHILLCETALFLGKKVKAWAIMESDLDKAKTVTAASFGEYDFIPKPEANFNMSSAKVTSAADAALAIFTAAGRDLSTKIIKKIILETHPDRNTAPGAHELTVNLNVAWDKLRKQMGWT